MQRASILRGVPLAALLLVACSDGGPLAAGEEADLAVDGPLTAVLPDLAPEPGTVGTDRYVPTLERILHRAVGVVRERRGEEAAQRVVAEAQSLRGEIRAAREAGNQAAVQEGVKKLEGFSARVGLRVFGAGVVRHVHRDAAGKLDALVARLREAHAAGTDVSRPTSGAQQARRMLAAARTAAEKGQPAAALTRASHALDLVVRIGAAL